MEKASTTWPSREPVRLCGYLQKLSGKGPLRCYRTRWFVFDARRCYLYYFKGPQDALPLGHLDIADACFSYQGPDDAAEPGAEPPAHFEVHSAGAVTVLKVGARAPEPGCALSPCPEPAPRACTAGPALAPQPAPRSPHPELFSLHPSACPLPLSPHPRTCSRPSALTPEPFYVPQLAPQDPPCTPWPAPCPA